MSKTTTSPRIAISSCLLGEKVRYDGTDKKLDIISTIPEDLIRFIPVCPEVAIGMGIPRPPIQLIESESNIKAIQIDNPDKNFTHLLTRYGKKMAHELKDISGYVFKARSPSCGFKTTPVTREDNTVYIDSGLYARQILQHTPGLPVTDESGIATPEQTELFLYGVLDYCNQQGHMDADSITQKKIRLSQYIFDYIDNL